LNKEALTTLIINQYKFDLLSEHLKQISQSDLFYEDIQLNKSSILKSVFQMVGFPFYGEEILDEYEELYDYLEEHYFDNVYSIEHSGLIQLIEKCNTYLTWLVEQKIKFDNGTIEM